MINTKALLKRNSLFQRFTGLTPKEYYLIKDKFYSAWQKYVQSKNNDPERKRKYGGGNKPKSLKSLDDKLVFILCYVRIYPLQFIQGMMFDISEARANIWIHSLLPLLEEALGYAHKLAKRGKSLDEVLEEFPELRQLGVLGDGVERPSKRPKDKQKQKNDYSGKKKHHTRKNIVLTNPKNRKVVYLSPTYGGRDHDKKILDQAFAKGPSKGKGPPGINDDIDLALDLGFLGYSLAGLRVMLPFKKPKGKELTSTQKAQNAALAKLRIKVEHAIGGIKISKSVADTYRNTKLNIDDTLMNVACGLHNLRVACRYVETN